MHLVIDARCIHAHQGGIGFATSHLLKAMGTRLRGHRLSALIGPHFTGDFDNQSIELITTQGAMIDPEFDHLHVPDLLLDLKADVYLNPTFAIPAIKTVSGQVAVIHDLVFEDHPEWVEPQLRDYLAKSARFAAQHADRIVTVSAYSAERIQAVYDMPPARIACIPNGIPAEAFQVPGHHEIVAVRGRYQLGRPYLLYLGSIEGKKGIAELIAAFDRMLRDGSTHDLVLAGGRGSDDFDLPRLLASITNPERIRVLGYLPEEHKRPLIAGCELLVYPSKYEGFGLPPAEALALGKPCVVHDGTSLPEVVGDIGIRVDVTDRHAFAAAMQRGLTDPSVREHTRKQGPGWIRSQFSWDRAAAAYLALCADLVGG